MATQKQALEAAKKAFPDVTRVAKFSEHITYKTKYPCHMIVGSDPGVDYTFRTWKDMIAWCEGTL